MRQGVDPSTGWAVRVPRLFNLEQCRGAAGGTSASHLDKVLP